MGGWGRPSDDQVWSRADRHGNEMGRRIVGATFLPGFHPVKDAAECLDHAGSWVSPGRPQRIHPPVAANRSLHPSGADGMFTYMKSTLFGGLVLLTAVAFPVLANEADMNIACTSILVNDATASDVAETTFEIRFTSDFSDTAVNSLNGEWYQVIGTVGYQSVFTLESPDFDIAETGVLDVEIPQSGDANLNFLTDF